LDQDPPHGPQVDGPLVVREEEAAFVVVREGDPEDWLARFEKGDEFPARAWAENMAEVYNRRLRERDAEHPRPHDDRPSGP
jgi:hypothetical protein